MEHNFQNYQITIACNYLFVNFIILSMPADDEMADKCALCGSEASKKCSACRQASYCSKEHQQAHWKSHKSTCRPFLIRKNDTKGRYLIASRDIKKSELLFKEDPLIIGPKTVSPDPVCLGCLKPIISLSSSPKCPKCKWPVCNIQCSGLQNEPHSLECAVLAVESKKERKKFKYELITPLRCVLQKKFSTKKWEIISQMEDHLDTRTSNTDVYRDDRELYLHLKKQILDNLSDYSDVTENLFHRVCGILDVNGIDVPIASTELSALYQTFGLIEHSCLPNIKIYFNNFQLSIKSAKPIPKDENLRTMYTNILWGTHMRQEHLLSTKYFTCVCPRCKDPTELGTYFSAIRCLQDNCNGYLLPINPVSIDDAWKCSKCSIAMPSNDVNEIVSAFSFEVENILEQSNPDVQQVETLLMKLLSVLHPHHYNCFSVKHSLIQLYGRRDGYQYSDLSIDLLNRKIEYCRELTSVLSILDETGSRASFYMAVIKYELASAMLETMRRTFMETLNLSLILENGKEAKHLLSETACLLNEDKNSEMSLRLISSCRNLFKEIDDLLRGQFFTDY